MGGMEREKERESEGQERPGTSSIGAGGEAVKAEGVSTLTPSYPCAIISVESTLARGMLG
jgi:hypothetical protein